MLKRSENIEGVKMEKNEYVLKKITVVWENPKKDKTIEGFLLNEGQGGITIDTGNVHLFIPYHSMKYYYSDK